MAGVWGGVGDGLGMARNRKGSDKSILPQDKERRGYCEGARGCTLATNVLCALETLSRRMCSSKCAFCLSGPIGLGSGTPFPSSEWALSMLSRALGAAGRQIVALPG